MEINSIFILQPILVEYTENNQIQKKIFLIDFINESVFHNSTIHGEAQILDNELSRQIIDIIKNKKNQPQQKTQNIDQINNKKKSLISIVSNRN
jgi:hypothetical protein